MKSNMINFCAGASLGVLITLLIAFSSSPVVSSVASVLIAAAVIFLSLKEAVPRADKPLSDNIIARIMGFSLFGALALVGGLSYRVHLISEQNSISFHYKELLQIGFEKSEARTISLELFRSSHKAPTSETPDPSKFILFSGNADAAGCSRFSNTHYGDYKSLRTEMLASRGAFEKLANEVHSATKSKSMSERKEFLKGAVFVICQSGR